MVKVMKHISPDGKLKDKENEVHWHLYKILQSSSIIYREITSKVKLAVSANGCWFHSCKLAIKIQARSSKS